MTISISPHKENEMVNWQKYVNQNPDQYDWTNYWSSYGAQDLVARPHGYIYVGSYCTKIPKNVDVIVNVAQELDNRNDAVGKTKYKIGLIDPGDQQNNMYMFNKVVQYICHIVDFVGDLVFIHCASGMNRSISVAATASAILDHTTVIDKLKLIAKARPEIWPEPCYVVMGQILNKEFPE